jgi:hypothetical protein
MEEQEIIIKITEANLLIIQDSHGLLFHWQIFIIYVNNQACHFKDRNNNQGLKNL